MPNFKLAEQLFFALGYESNYELTQEVMRELAHGDVDNNELRTDAIEEVEQRQNVEWPRRRMLLIALFANSFSDDELKEMLHLLTTPVMQKFYSRQFRRELMLATAAPLPPYEG